VNDGIGGIHVTRHEYCNWISDFVAEEQRMSILSEVWDAVEEE
jgi:hypothetical protein